MPITVGPRIKPAADWARKQIERTDAAAEAWLEGVKAPKKDPVKEAIAKKEKWKAAMREAIAEDRQAKALGKVDSAIIAEIADRVGADGFRRAVRARESKIVAKVEALHREVSSHVAKMDAMPVDTREQREAKMIANKRGMEDIGKRMKGV